MRWQGSDLSRLPEVLEQQISTGRFHTAAVGACNNGKPQGHVLHHLPPGGHALLSPLVEGWWLSHGSAIGAIDATSVMSAIEVLNR